MSGGFGLNLRSEPSKPAVQLYIDHNDDDNKSWITFKKGEKKKTSRGCEWT